MAKPPKPDKIGSSLSLNNSLTDKSYELGQTQQLPLIRLVRLRSGASIYLNGVQIIKLVAQDSNHTQIEMSDKTEYVVFGSPSYIANLFNRP